MRTTARLSVPCLVAAMLTTATAVVGAEVPPPNFTVAFIGDQGNGSNARSVLQLIADEGAEAVMHAGDFDYAGDPAAWDALINDVLGPDFPYFASVGNHDHDEFYGAGGYQEYLEARMNRIGVSWEGDLGAMSRHRYAGITFVLTSPDEFGQGDGIHDVYIRDQFALDDSIWRVSAWHKNMNKMQVGEKPDESGWGVYEASRKAGAIIATGHEHSYCRSHLFSDIDDQVIASTSNTLVLAADDLGTPDDEGRTFVFVSGLGGRGIRDQNRDGPWWAAIYTSDQDATYGALFGVFNYLGDPRLAYFYFKDVNGFIVDEFFVETSLLQPTTTTLSTTTTTLPVVGIVAEQVETGAAADAATIATAGDLVAMNDDVYVAAVTAKANIDVVSVDGLGVAWNEVAEQCSGRDQTGVSVWMSDGPARTDGPVSATLAATPQNAAIAVIRYSGVRTAAPVGAVVTANSNGIGGACSGGTDTHTYVMPITPSEPDSVVYSAVAMRNRTHDPGTGFTERAEVVSGTAGVAAGIAISDRPVALPVPINASGSFNGPIDWAAAAMVLIPAFDTTTTTTTTTTLALPEAGVFHSKLLRIGALKRAAGRQRYSLKSDDINAAGLAYDPMTETLTLMLEAGGTVLADATIAAGDPRWNASGLRYRWKARTGEHPAGLTRLTIRDTGDLMKVTVRTRNVDLASMSEPESVTVTMSLGDDVWAGPTPSCSLAPGGSAIKCR